MLFIVPTNSKDKDWLIVKLPRLNSWVQFLEKWLADIIRAIFSPKEITDEPYTADRNRIIPDKSLFESRLDSRENTRAAGFTRVAYC